MKKLIVITVCVCTAFICIFSITPIRAKGNTITLRRSTITDLLRILVKAKEMIKRKKVIRKTPLSYESSVTNNGGLDSPVKTVIEVSFTLKRRAIIQAIAGGYARKDKGNYCITYIKRSSEAEGLYGVSPVAWISSKQPTPVSHTRAYDLPKGKHTIKFVVKVAANTTCAVAGAALEVIVPSN